MKTTKLLRIDSSANPANSVSKKLADEFVEQWLAKHPQSVVMHRDLSQDLPPHFTAETLNALMSGDHSNPAVALSNQLIEELQQADMVLISTPMYNFGIPSTLKAYFDHVTRAGVTFKYTEQGPVGLLEDKQAVAIIASGGDYRTAPANSMNFVDGYLQTILGFIGIAQVELIHAAGLAVRRPEDVLLEANHQIASYTASTAA